jgi:hypothetical protein
MSKTTKPLVYIDRLVCLEEITLDELSRLVFDILIDITMLFIF